MGRRATKRVGCKSADEVARLVAANGNKPEGREDSGIFAWRKVGSCRLGKCSAMQVAQWVDFLHVLYNCGDATLR